VQNSDAVGVGRIRQGIAARSARSHASGITARAVALLVLGTGWLSAAPPAQAFTAHNGAAATVFASGFEFDPATRLGPFGVASDASGRIFVSAQANLYRFGPTGGPAAPARVNSAPIGRAINGLTFGVDGRLYASRLTGERTGDIVELDPSDGSVVRSLTDEFPCPAALATDPLTGDLYVSTLRCGAFIGRIADPSSAKPRESVWIDEFDADGLTFGPDGRLYVAHHPLADGTSVSVFSRDGTRRSLAAVPESDGAAIGVDSSFVIVNRKDGFITKVDIATGRQTELVSGGTRGDLIAVGADGCLYATQTDSVLRVTNADGSCRPPAGSDGTTTGAGLALGGGLAPTTVALQRSVASRCPATRRVSVRLAFRGHRLRQARVFVAGRRVKTLRGRALKRPARIGSLPAKAFTVTVRATTRKGRRLVRRTKYAACGAPLRKR
jgi:sugar lactone lactonase YvrE